MQKKTILQTLLFSVLLLSAKAQEITQKLILSAAAEKGVDAVILFDETEFEIINVGESVTKRHWAVMVFNEDAAEEHALFEAYYDSFSKISHIDGFLYNVAGKVQEKLKTRNVDKIGLGSSGDGISDNKALIAQFTKHRYEFPYVVEFSFEKQNKNMLFYPTWSPLGDEKTKIISSSFSITSANVPFRMKEINTDRADIVKSINLPYHKNWEISNVAPLELERYSEYENLPVVFTAPQNFKINEYSSEFNSWSDIGQFYYDLNKGRDELPAETLQKLQELVKPEMDIPTKTKLVYEFMQSHTRYMSIQLGIGGWQSMPASLVADKGYGDCKALTNYTIALLKNVGVVAHPALIKAGSYYSSAKEDFPSMNFNHVIACVPTANDTIWLECTSQTNAMGYQGDFTGNRKALVITPLGSKLVNTTQYKPEQNFQHRTAEVWLKEDGKAEVKIASTYGGLQQDRRAYILNNLDQEEQRKFMLNSINISGLDLAEFSLSQEKNRIPIVYEKAEVFVRKLASTSGKRLFLKPNLLSSFYKTPVKKEDRVTNFYLNPSTYTFEDSDEIIFHLPVGLAIENMPKANEIKSIFGAYTSSLERTGDILKYNRKVKVNGGSYDKEAYTEWVKFLKAVNRADKQRVVFVNGAT